MWLELNKIWRSITGVLPTISVASVGGSTFLVPQAYAIPSVTMADIDSAQLNRLVSFDMQINANSENLYAGHRSHSSHRSLKPQISLLI